MIQSSRVGPDMDLLGMYFPIPGFNNLPINAFVLKAQEPILVDTGGFVDASGADTTKSFMTALRSVIEPADLKWIWLTHADMDHVGCVHEILEEAPQVKVATTFLTMGRMSVYRPLPIDRVYLINPGQSLDLGDRTLTSVKPPTFDAADTAGAYDSKSRTFFCADCFGALLLEPAETAADVPPEELARGQLLWSTIDAPWVHSVDPKIFEATLNTIRRMDPELILSSHLPPARGMTEQLLSALAAVPGAKPFVGPDQKALQEMLTAAPV